MDEPKIVTTYGEPVHVIARGEEIILARRIGLHCEGFDRANATSLRDALTRCLEEGK